MEAYGLSQRLGVPVEEAAAIMESYFGAFPLVKHYMDQTVAEAKIRGATRTPFGRVRPLPDLHAANFRLRQAAERQAMNAGIQGLAADIFKLALVRLDRDLNIRAGHMTDAADCDPLDSRADELLTMSPIRPSVISLICFATSSGVVLDGGASPPICAARLLRTSALLT